LIRSEFFENAHQPHNLLFLSLSGDKSLTRPFPWKIPVGPAGLRHRRWAAVDCRRTSASSKWSLRVASRFVASSPLVGRYSSVESPPSLRGYSDFVFDPPTPPSLGRFSSFVNLATTIFDDRSRRDLASLSSPSNDSASLGCHYPFILQGRKFPMPRRIL